MLLHAGIGFFATSVPMEGSDRGSARASDRGEATWLVTDPEDPNQPMLPQDPASEAFLAELMRENPPEPPAPTPPTPLIVPPENRITLGIEESNHITNNWLGVDKPTPHSAKLSTVEQPQLEQTPGMPWEPGTAAGVEAPPLSPPEVVPVDPGAQGSPQRLAQPVPIPAIEAKPGETDGKGERTPERAAVEADVLADPMLPGPAPVAAVPAQQPRRVEGSPQRPTPPSAQQPSAPQPTHEAPGEVGPVPMPSNRGEKPGQASSGGTQPGIKSEKEADAASTTTPIEIRPGQPAAAQGLDITTRRPNFTRLTRVTAYPDNPLLEVTFNHLGVVTKVRLVESSGNADVDGPVVNAIYQWTARGKQLAELSPRAPEDPGQTLTIKVRIILR